MPSKLAYGYVNVPYFARSADGDRRWFRTRAERDAALRSLRARAERDGLSRSSALTGIYPVKAPLSKSIEAAIAIESGQEDS